MTQPTAIVFSLLKRAASMLQEQRDEIFNSHQVGGRIVADDEFSSNAAKAVEEMDQWIREAGAVLNAAALPVVCIPDDADLLADMQQAQILRLTAPAKPVYEHHITDAMAYAMAGTASPVEWTLQRQAASLAKLVEEWITGGIRGGTDWTSGLEQVLLRRLRRFQPGPVDDKDHPRFLAGYQAGMQDAKRDAADTERPVIVVGRHTVEQLAGGKHVKLGRAILVPDDEMFNGGGEVRPETTPPSPLLRLGEDGKQFVRDAIRSAYDRGYNDARNAKSVPGDSALGYRGRGMSEKIAVDVLARLSRLPSQTNLRGHLAHLIRRGINDQGYDYLFKGDKLTISSDELFAIDVTKLADFIYADLTTLEGNTQ